MLKKKRSKEKLLRPLTLAVKKKKIALGFKTLLMDKVHKAKGGINDLDEVVN
jgi:hypothetical protein